MSHNCSLTTSKKQKSMSGMISRLPGGSSMSESMKCAENSGNLRKSTGSMAANFSTPGKATLMDIDSEYIKNLQQQVYFLELEANFLRGQAKKATDMHPQMTAEAERMLNKLRSMQAEVDGLQLEAKRKDSSIDIMRMEQERLNNKLKLQEDAHTREKRLLVDEVVQLKKERELQDRENSRKDSQLLQLHQEFDKSQSSLRSAEAKMQMLNNQVEQKAEQMKLVQQTLDEKRKEIVSVEAQLRELEDKYYSSTATLHDKLTQDLREEVRILRQRIKETELSAEQDKYLRTKMVDDSSHLVKENALLSQQISELQKQLEREKSLRENMDSRRSQNITELVQLKERDKQQFYELSQLRDQLQNQKELTDHYQNQLMKQEKLASNQELSVSSARSRMAELEGLQDTTTAENSQLRRDKMLLVDHVADLQKQVEEKEKELSTARSQTISQQTRLQELEHLKVVESTLHVQKWEEFSRLADSMKSLSHSMAQAASSSPTPRSAQLQY